MLTSTPELEAPYTIAWSLQQVEEYSSPPEKEAVEPLVAWLQAKRNESPQIISQAAFKSVYLWYYGRQGTVRTSVTTSKYMRQILFDLLSLVGDGDPTLDEQHRELLELVNGYLIGSGEDYLSSELHGLIQTMLQ